MALHETQLPSNRHACQGFNHAVDLGYDESVTSPSTVAALNVGIAALAVHETSLNIVRQCKGNILVAQAIGTLSDAGVAAAATNAAVRTLFGNQDSALTTTDKRTFACYG